MRLGHSPHYGRRARLIVAATFLMALVLSILPWPVWTEQFRPDWVALVLIYWCMAAPDRVGVGTGWIAGLMLDILYGSLLGEHALAKSLLAFLAVRFHLQLRMFPRWQQAVVVLLLVSANNLLVLWIKNLAGQAPSAWHYIAPGIVSMLIWPWLFVILRDIRRHGNVA
jgi:rod shape-determining protein MreD